MTSFRYTPPCPPVQEGDAESFVARARWFIDYGGPARGDAEPDLRWAMALGPSLWEPWWMLADLSDDPALRLHCYDEAIRRGGGAGVELRRAHHLFWARPVHGGRAGFFQDPRRGHVRQLWVGTCEARSSHRPGADRRLRRRRERHVKAGSRSGAVSRPGVVGPFAVDCR